MINGLTYPALFSFQGRVAHEKVLPDAPSDGQNFPGVDGAAMGCPPRMNELNDRTLV